MGGGRKLEGEWKEGGSWRRVSGRREEGEWVKEEAGGG